MSVRESILELASTSEQAQEPSLYQVVLLNDDATPMDFVVGVLVKLYNHGLRAATNVMLSIHNTGSGVAGVYVHEIAEARLQDTMALAKRCGHPLRGVLQKADSQ